MQKEIKIALYCCFYWLAGCVAEPLKVSQQEQVTGRVALAEPLKRAAYVTLRVNVIRDGRILELARERYRVEMLPLRFSFSVDTEERQGLMLAGDLTWEEEGVEQATQLLPVPLDQEVMMLLQPLRCFPRCGAGRMPP